MANTTTTLTVLDAYSNVFTVFTGLPPGGTLSANSNPVVIASDQAQVNVGSHVISLPTFPGLSSGTNGIGNVSVTSITLPGLSTGANVIGNVSVSSITLPGLPTGANTIGNAILVDSVISGNKATVSAFHNADNQQPGGAAYGLLTGGVAQLLNQAGNLDRQREAGIDGVSSVGMQSGLSNFAMSFKTTAPSTIVAGTRVVTPALMSGTVGGVAWSIQVGTTLTVDTGVNLEYVVVTAVTATTFTAIYALGHTGPFNLIGFVYNQARDAAGETDGATGIGTAVAAEYEYNGGAPGSLNFDRARSVQAKGRTTTAISSGGTQGSLSMVVASAGTIKCGMQVMLQTGSFPTVGEYEVAYVSTTYVEGTTTIPLVSAIVNNKTYLTFSYDSFLVTGPLLAGFNAAGIGIEEEAIFDPITGLFYIERSATADSMAAPNIIAESPALFNSNTALFDRARAAPGTTGVEAVSSDGLKPTYGCANVVVAMAATPSDIVTLSGSATKTVRVKRVIVSGIATTAGTMDVSLVKRTVADTSGTSTVPPIAQYDSADAAASAVVLQYSANPTTGAGLMLKTQKLYFPLAANPGSPVVWDFCGRQDKALVLRGIAQQAALNFNGQALPGASGTTISYEIEWEEDNS